MVKPKKVFVNYKRFEPADRRVFEKLDPTPKDSSLTIGDWRDIPAIQYQGLYEIIGKYQVITRLGRFAHPQLLLVPDGRTLPISAQKISGRPAKGGQSQTHSPIRDPYGDVLGEIKPDEQSASCNPSRGVAALFMEQEYPGLKFSSTVEGAEELAGRLVANEYAKEPADFSPPVRKPLLFVEENEKHRKLVISSGFPLDPATQIFLRWGNSTVQVRRNDLEDLDSFSLKVMDTIELPHEANSFDLILVDHAGNQALHRYRIVPAKGGLYLHKEDEKRIREMEDYRLALASMIDRGYKVVDNGKISVDYLQVGDELHKRKAKISDFVSLNSFLALKHGEQKEGSPWDFVVINPHVNLQKEEGAKLYSRPEIHRDRTVAVSPFEFQFANVSRERYQNGRDENGKIKKTSVLLKGDRVQYIVLRNWLNGDVVFESEIPELGGDQKELFDYYENLEQGLLHAVKKYREKHGMQKGQPIPPEMVATEKARSYPLLIQGGSKAASKSLPGFLADAKFKFRIVDTRRDDSLPTDIGTTDYPLFYRATGADLKERPIAIRGEVYQLDIDIPSLLEGTKLSDADVSDGDELDFDRYRDKYGNYIFVGEDKGKKVTHISVFLKPRRGRSQEAAQKFTTFDIDFSSWVPAIGELKGIGLQEVQQPQAFVGPNSAYAIYSHFSKKRWRQAKHTLPSIEKQLVEIEQRFGLKPGTAIASVLFQDASEVNASVHRTDPQTVRIWDEMLDSFGNWRRATWHEAAHSLDFHFKISQDEQWREFYDSIKKHDPNFFLFIAEKNFLPVSGGHPLDSPEELLASVISSLTHPDILAYLRQRAGLKPDRRYVFVYARTLSTLSQVLYKKLPANAPILQEIARLRRQVGQVLLDTNK